MPGCLSDIWASKPCSQRTPCGANGKTKIYESEARGNGVTCASTLVTKNEEPELNSMCNLAAQFGD